MSGLLCWMAWSVWILKSQTILTLSFSTTFAGLWLYHLTLPTNPNFWHGSKCITVAILSYLCLYSFWASFSPSAINWVIGYRGKIHSLQESLNNLSSDWSRYREILCSTQSAIIRSSLPLSILAMYCLPVSLCGWYILFIVIIFRAFLSITFSSSFVHFSIPALCLRIHPESYCPNCISTIYFQWFQLSHSPIIFLLDLHFSVLHFISFH